jgi:hypothetical protein
MPITKDMDAGDVIHDFVHSENKQFDGDSKKQRIKRGLAVYYRKQREKGAQEPTLPRDTVRGLMRPRDSVDKQAALREAQKRGTPLRWNKRTGQHEVDTRTERGAVQISQVPGGSKPQSPAKLSDGNDHPSNDGKNGEGNSGTGATPSPVVARLTRMVRAEVAAVLHWEAMSVPERRAYRMALAAWSPPAGTNPSDDEDEDHFTRGFVHGYTGKPHNGSANRHYTNGHRWGKDRHADQLHSMRKGETDTYEPHDAGAHAYEAWKEYRSN